MFNPTGEFQLIAQNDRERVQTAILSTGELRNVVDDMRARGLVILAICLLNCQTNYVYEWRRDLQSRTWLNCRLTMIRRRGEYKGTQHAIIMPAKERTYTLAQFEMLLLE